MKIVIYLLLLSYLFPRVFAQPEVEWLRTFDGGDSINDCFQDIFPLEQGGYVLCGYKNNSNGGYNSGSIWILRTDNMGRIIWENGFDHGTAFSIIQTDDNDYIIGAAGDGDFIGMRVDDEGNLVWLNRYTQGHCQAVIELKDGDFILAGWRDLGNRLKIGYVVRINDEGQIQWSREYNAQGARWSQLYAMRETDGGIVLCGVAVSMWNLKIDFNGEQIWNRLYRIGNLCVSWTMASCRPSGFGISGWLNGLNNNWRDQAFLMKINADGEQEWLNVFNSDEGNYLQQGYGITRLQNNDFAISGRLSNDDGAGPFIIRTTANGEERWRIVPDFFEREDFGIGFDVFFSVVSAPDNGIITAGTVMHGASNQDGILLKFNPEIFEPVIFFWSPRDTILSVLLNDSVEFEIQARDHHRRPLNYLWLHDADTLSFDSTDTVHFDELGESLVSCLVSNGEFTSNINWHITTCELFIHSYRPDTLLLTIKRGNNIIFSIDSVAYIDDGRGRPAYQWTLIDRLDDDRRAEAGQDSTAAIRFERKGRYAVEGLAYLRDARDSVTWEVEVRGIIRAYWPRCEVVSIRPGEEAAFGVAPFEPEDRRPCLSYRWQVDQVDIVDEDSSEVRLVFPNRGRFEVGVFVVDSMQVDSVNWELAETDSQRWTVNVAIPDRIVHSKFQIPNSKFDIAPNPFNALAEVRFELEQAADVKLQMFDISGRLVRTPVDGWLEAGRHSITTESRDLPAG
ncbi:MAG: hypothetical protein FJY65_07985, partial [Calditrichaeota bacterium]|nr:hypothetical protein [Calditrichota bacterium]